MKWKIIKKSEDIFIITLSNQEAEQSSSSTTNSEKSCVKNLNNLRE